MSPQALTISRSCKEIFLAGHSERGIISSMEVEGKRAPWVEKVVYVSRIPHLRAIQKKALYKKGLIAQKHS